MISHAQRTIYKNSIVIMFARVISMIASFLIVPFIINSLGLSGYGVWESIMAIAVFATLILTSVSQTLMWRISIAYGANDTETVKEWFRNGIFLTLIQVIVIVPLVYIYRWNIIVFFDIPEEFIIEVAELLPLICGIMLIGGVHESAGAILSGFQKSGYVILYKSITTIIGQIVSIAFLLAGFGLVSIAIGFIVNSLLAFIILNWKAKKLINGLSFFPKIISQSQIKLINRFFLLTLIGAITLLFRNHISKLILGSMASVESVANYGIASRVSSLVYLTVTFIMTPTITAVSSAFATNDQKTITSIYTETLSSFSFLNNLITLMLCVLAERLIVLWIGFCSVEIISFTLILLIGQSIAVLTTAVGVSVCTGIGRREIETYYIILNLILNIIVLVILVKIIGPIGAVIASSSTWAISGLYFLFIMHKKIDLPIASTKASLISLSITLILVVIFRGILFFFPVGNNRWDAITEMIFITVIILPVFVFLNVKFKLTPTILPLIIDKVKGKIKIKK